MFDHQEEKKRKSFYLFGWKMNGGKFNTKKYIIKNYIAHTQLTVCLYTIVLYIKYIMCAVVVMKTWKKKIFIDFSLSFLKVVFLLKNFLLNNV
jgi:hypothetical protein